MARICIVLATYNGKKYLQEMLDSLVAQTRPADMIIAVDDGSTDSTMSILEQNLDRLPMEIVRSPKNQGHRAAFSRGLEEARHRLGNDDYIALADQDDIWLPEKLETLEREIDEAALVYGDAEVIDGKGELIARRGGHTQISTRTTACGARLPESTTSRDAFRCSVQASCP